MHTHTLTLQYHSYPSQRQETDTESYSHQRMTTTKIHINFVVSLCWFSFHVALVHSNMNVFRLSEGLKNCSIPFLRANRVGMKRSKRIPHPSTIWQSLQVKLTGWELVPTNRKRLLGHIFVWSEWELQYAIHIMMCQIVCKYPWGNGAFPFLSPHMDLSKPYITFMSHIKHVWYIIFHTHFSPLSSVSMSHAS